MHIFRMMLISFFCLTVVAMPQTSAETGKNTAATAETFEVTAIDRAGSASISGQQTSPDSSVADSAVGPVGVLTIVTMPESVSVVVDGVKRGLTPLTLSGVAAGEHAIELRKTGYYLKKARVTVFADSSANYAFELLAPAKLVITSDPSGAAVFLDGKQMGTTPFENAKIKPGERTLEATLEGYLPFRRKISLASGAADSLAITLVKKKSLEPAAAAEASPASKPKSLTARIIVLSVFVLFGVGIIIAELAGP